MTTKKPTRRRRHAYSPELTDLICERLLDGTSLRQICQDKNMPARSSLLVWLEQHPQFARKYMIAKQIQIDCLLGEKLDIADDRSNDWIEREGPDGKKFRVVDHENFRRSNRPALMAYLEADAERYHWMRWGPLRMPKRPSSA